MGVIEQQHDALAADLMKQRAELVKEFSEHQQALWQFHRRLERSSVHAKQAQVTAELFKWIRKSDQILNKLREIAL